MKKWIVLFVVVSALSISLVAFAAPDKGERPRPEQAMRGGPGERGMPGMAPWDTAAERLLNNPQAAEKLGLSDTQVAQLKDLHLHAAKEAIPLRGAVELAALELREAMAQAAPDEGTVMTAIDRLHQAEAGLQKSRVHSRLAARAILGPEAIEKIQQHARQRMQQRLARPDQPDQSARPDRPIRRQGPRGPMRPALDGE